MTVKGLDVFRLRVLELLAKPKISFSMVFQKKIIMGIFMKICELGVFVIRAIGVVCVFFCKIFVKWISQNFD